MGFTHVIDCTASDPPGFYYRLYGSRCDGLFGRDLSKVTLGEIPCPIYAGAIMRDYNTVKSTGSPAFHKVIARLDWRPTSYTRLIVPLADDEGQISQLLAMINLRKLPELGALDW